MGWFGPGSKVIQEAGLLGKSEKEIGLKGLFQSVQIYLVGYAPNFPFRPFH
jgi:hypothetical protein